MVHYSTRVWYTIQLESGALFNWSPVHYSTKVRYIIGFKFKFYIKNLYRVYVEVHQIFKILHSSAIYHHCRPFLSGIENNVDFLII